MRLKQEVTAGLTRTITAIEQIHSQKLYLEEADTLDEFCNKNWGWSANYVRRLLQAKEVIKNVPIGTITKESQARVLVSVAPEKMSAVVAEAKRIGPITAKTLNEAKNTVLATTSAKASPDKASVLDKTGCKVPDKALKFWNRREEVKDWMDMLSEVKCGIEKAKKADDLLYIEVRQSIIGDLNMIREGLSYALPFAVCTSCNGQLADKCSLCKGRGVISESLYKKVPAEIRAMREKMAKKGASK